MASRTPSSRNRPSASTAASTSSRRTLSVISRQSRPGSSPVSLRMARRLSWRVVPISCCAERLTEEHTSELQSQFHLVCRLLLEKKKKKTKIVHIEKNKKKTTRKQ